MTGSILIAVAVLAPVVASILVVMLRPAGLGAGRAVVVGCGIAAVAALATLVQSISTSDGLVGDVVALDLRVDRATALLLAAVTATATVVASFARRNIDLDPRALRFFALFGVLVSGSALVVVPGGWVPLAVGWVASTWALVGLIGHRAELSASRIAMVRTGRALVVGDVALLAAVLVIVNVAGANATRDVGAAAAELGATSLLGLDALDVVALLLVIAGASRSALFPFHRWLVGTLAAPTPVSALVHAGFVSGAGLLMIRFGPVILTSFVVYIAFAIAVLSVGLALGAGATRVDVKGKLAWSTVAQMGFMVVQCAVGAFSSAVFHIIGHGMYKASLFLGAGDAVSSGLRASRRAPALALPSRSIRLAAGVAVPTVAVAAGMLLLPPDVSDGGVVLAAVFAWLTVAHGVWGWLGRGVMPVSRALATSLVGGVAGIAFYLGGLRIVEALVKPAFDTETIESGVNVATLVITLVVGATIFAIISLAPSAAIARLRPWFELRFEQTAHPGVASLGGVLARSSAGATLGPQGALQAHGLDGVSTGASASIDDAAERRAEAMTRSQIRADVARAGNIIAPNWPLTSFVAVNPLGGLEQRGFDEAAAMARKHLGARTHLTLADYRNDHSSGLTTPGDLRWAIESRFAELCAGPSISIGGQEITVVTVIELDMLHGPDERRGHGRSAARQEQRSSQHLSDLIDATLGHSVTQFVARPGSTLSFAARWRRDASQLADLRKLLTPGAIAWLDGLGEDPAGVIDAAFRITGVDEGDRVDEMRRHLARFDGWAGYAKWRTDWAHPGERRPALRLIDLVAARSALEAACAIATGGPGRPTSFAPLVTPATVDERVDAVLAELGALGDHPEAHAAVANVLARVEPSERNATWLQAQERHVDNELLTALDRPDVTAAADVPDAQLAFCIDVRSEGLRRHLEAAGSYETIGFAGFFGVAMAVRRLEWDHFEPRCPVLVDASVRSVEHPATGPEAHQQVERLLARDRTKAGLASAHAGTKYGLGAPFVMAEAAGWVAGPVAAVRTLLPPRPRQQTRPPSVMAIDDGDESGLQLEQRIFTAEAVLRTMGLTKRFAPLVVLCGHASETINNPHATALDCGACAGASGEDNARSVARLLNDAAVRDGLRERAIDIPASTHFAPALHETVSDRVTVLDRHDVPTTHADVLARLDDDLDVAARRQSEQRAAHLPGRVATVAQRGADWAQVRPEWGLARNSSFIIGPRAMTAGLDLGGRSFLHTYDPDDDPDGKVLETIMTAPLVVGHWISSQYYFSTVDPETFGAGDKLIHNVVGDIGVISGEHGGLRVGLPTQSTHCGRARHHQPVRLLAVIQAPIERVERIIRENPILTTLTEGSWIRVAARSDSNEPWSIRTPNGTWNAAPRPAPTP